MYISFIQKIHTNWQRSQFPLVTTDSIDCLTDIDYSRVKANYMKIKVHN